MRITIESTIAFLYSKPPSSLRMLLRKFILNNSRAQANNLYHSLRKKGYAIYKIWGDEDYLIQHTYRDLYFNGNFWHNDLIASTTTILNSSAISDMKFVICFIRRSTLDSFPVFKSVVIASVAMLRF
jgi:hypothetical protein